MVFFAKKTTLTKSVNYLRVLMKDANISYHFMR